MAAGSSPAGRSDPYRRSQFAAFILQVRAAAEYCRQLISAARPGISRFRYIPGELAIKTYRDRPVRPGPEGGEKVSAAEPVIVARNIGKTYKMGEVRVEALCGASFVIYPAETVCILGPSGSGKTTLLNLIGGMDRVSAGELYYRDISLHTADSRALTVYRRNAVGFIFQFFNLLPNLDAWENVHLAAEIARAPLDTAAVLADVGLAGRVRHFPSQLSGGEQQRVAIARALVKNPDLLLCDEPTGSLDFSTSIQVLSLLRRFSSEAGKTVVLITHNTAIAQIADRVFYLKDGRLTDIKENSSPLPPEKVNW
jgi:putative ABC transport system ATP-binding protein